MPYLTFTILNLYLDLLPVIGFHSSLESLKQKQAECTTFSQTPLKGICTFSVLLEDTFRV